MASEKVRLSKLMSERGLSSRREADVLIEAGYVKVNGEVLDTLGVKVDSGVEIEVDSQAKKQQQKKVTIIFHKPVGIVSSQAEKGYRSAISCIDATNQSQVDKTGKKLQNQHFKGLATAGRLDINSQGLLVFTQDGRVAKQLIGENTRIEKEYLVRVNQQVSAEQLAKLSFGLSLDGKALKKAVVKQINDEQLRMCLKEGKKRQIRRMCDLAGLPVYGLKRVRVGNCRLGKLEEGKWCFVENDTF